MRVSTELGRQDQNEEKWVHILLVQDVRLQQEGTLVNMHKPEDCYRENKKSDEKSSKDKEED